MPLVSASAGSERRDQAADLALRPPSSAAGSRFDATIKRGSPRRPRRLRERRSPAIASTSARRALRASISQRRKRCTASAIGQPQAAPAVRRGCCATRMPMSPSRRLTNMSSSVMSSPIASTVELGRAAAAQPAERDALVRGAVADLERLDDRQAARAAGASRATRRRAPRRLPTIASCVLGVATQPPVQAHRARLALDERARIARGERAQRALDLVELRAPAAAPLPTRRCRSATRRARRRTRSRGNRAGRSSTRSRGRPLMMPSVTPGDAASASSSAAVSPSIRASCGVGANGISVPSRSSAITRCGRTRAAANQPRWGPPLKPLPPRRHYKHDMAAERRDSAVPGRVAIARCAGCARDAAGGTRLGIRGAMVCAYVTSAIPASRRTRIRDVTCSVDGTACTASPRS